MNINLPRNFWAKKIKKMVKKNVGIINKEALNMIAAFLGISPGVNELIVYRYDNPTDDCLSAEHIAVSLEPEGQTFFGIPQKAVVWD